MWPVKDTHSVVASRLLCVTHDQEVADPPPDCSHSRCFSSWRRLDRFFIAIVTVMCESKVCSAVSSRWRHCMLGFSSGRHWKMNVVSVNWLLCYTLFSQLWPEIIWKKVSYPLLPLGGSGIHVFIWGFRWWGLVHVDRHREEMNGVEHDKKWQWKQTKRSRDYT